MKVTVVGLGRMGAPIARRLARHHNVADRDIDPTAQARLTGSAVAESDMEDLGEVQVLVTVLPGRGELRDALEDGAALERLPGKRHGSIWPHVLLIGWRPRLNSYEVRYVLLIESEIRGYRCLSP